MPGPEVQKQILFQFLPAGCGDAILIRFPDPDGILRLMAIDFGTGGKDFELRKQLLQDQLSVTGQIDLFVVTHLDADHIGGVIKLCKDRNLGLLQKTNCWWLNHSLPVSPPETPEKKGSKISAAQNADLKKLLARAGKVPMEPMLFSEIPKDFYGAKITLLSPTPDLYQKAADLTYQAEKKKALKISGRRSDHAQAYQDLLSKSFEPDDSLANGSSIAFLFEYAGFRGLFLADAYAGTILNSLTKLGYSPTNPIRVDLVKVSHHGSRKNTSSELLECIDCENYMVSVDGPNTHQLPDKEALVRIAARGTAARPVRLGFTYGDEKLRSIFTASEINSDENHFELYFPSPDTPLTYTYDVP